MILPIENNQKYRCFAFVVFSKQITPGKVKDMKSKSQTIFGNDIKTIHFTTILFIGLLLSNLGSIVRCGYNTSLVSVLRQRPMKTQHICSSKKNY